MRHAVIALVATWSQNLAYRGHGADLMRVFKEDTKVTAASRSRRSRWRSRCGST
ncbi:hypothetical protein MPHL43072_18825 [Mycolicibacterium phlei DSM 43072]|uniref:Uncharacterized protein n=1 Tax=Mycolicibacterium phlei DSM 43239 = CCUG 21000 TaxID=1226750 RepID=A0A5N5V9H6_MYCPH|nr:hypothetical protein MPHL21000_05915 [Mycolicibacterium phlei DSM 43239 = CCUG 21000]KXW67092.1 hypothetical protein MPHL43239_07090 [Mycolicibacterium phlei DSM 43239 = CCUG 21000]KXW70512.1 hypothetical protein MPHL43072_18825 [Mycolicibacterium phlei DSM 43072]KXW74060.1 hypothetical protein MPHL43070_09460 [Mycolicibacterium phlei DSM 43070]